MTQWKDIPGYEALYQASDDGRIRSAYGKVTYSSLHGVRHWCQRELKQSFYHNGFMVTLWKNGTPKKYLVARIIATTFHENLINSEMTVNHKDGNRRNNKASNLEWLTRQDNIKHGFETGLYPMCNKIIMRDGETELVFRSMAEASRFLNRSNQYISNAMKLNKAIKNKSGKEYQVIVNGGRK